MNNEERNQLAELVSSVVEGLAGDVEMERLNSLLDNDPAAIDYYTHYIAVHIELEKSSGNDQRMFPSVQTHSGRPMTRWAGATFLALAVGVALFLIVRLFDNRDSNDLAGQAQISPASVLAVVGSAAEAEWSLPGVFATTGTKLGAGKIQLFKGRIRLDFPAGEKVTVEGPASLEIVSADQMSIDQGRLVASVPQDASGFTVILPNGAVVDLGTEFAVDVKLRGENRVKVLKGSVVAMSNNSNGSTAWETTLELGEEVSIEKGEPLQKTVSKHQYLEPLQSTIQPLPVSENYTRMVAKSKPLGYWKFDETGANEMVKNEAGGIPLKLEMDAVIGKPFSALAAQQNNPGCLVVNCQSHQGFARSVDSFSGLNSGNGCSLESWVYSDSVDWQSLAVLTLDGAGPESRPKGVMHKPQLLLIERAGRSRTKMAHIHSDFAIRSVFRSPAGYLGGVNAYSSQSHLIHSWHHVVAVRTKTKFQVFVDGELSGEAKSESALDQEKYYLLIGRMHPLGNDIDARQWSGGIDEVALYDRPLDPEEIKRHFGAIR